MTTEIDDRLIAKLEELSQRSDALNEQLADPAVATNPTKCIELAKELGRLKRLVEPYRVLRGVRADLADNRAMLEDRTEDADLRELAESEIPELQAKHDEILESLKSVMVTDDDAAIDSVILEIRAGTGGDEAALFARDLFQMYTHYCENKGLRMEVLEQSGSDAGGFKEIFVSVKGPEVFRLLGYEGGGHRVQRVPETESQGRIHTSAATVAVLPEPEEIDIKIDWDKEVDEFVSRSGGPGGQNVNKVESAVRLVHKETGIAVSMRDEKSQHKNRAKARRILLTRVHDHHTQAQDAERASTRRAMIGSGDRSQRIRTYNFPQNRLTDHRAGLTLHSLDKIMMGELAGLIEALQRHDRSERLKNLSFAEQK